MLYQPLRATHNFFKVSFGGGFRYMIYDWWWLCYIYLCYTGKKTLTSNIPKANNSGLSKLVMYRNRPWAGLRKAKDLFGDIQRLETRCARSSPMLAIACRHSHGLSCTQRFGATTPFYSENAHAATCWMPKCLLICLWHGLFNLL